MISVIALGMLLSGCTPAEDPGRKPGEKLKVVATTGIVGDLAINIGGEHVDVLSLMGAGVDPHLYKASEGDVRRLGEADLILYNGLHLEARMAEVLERMKNRRHVVAVAEAVPEAQLLGSDDDSSHFDPHVWFDVKLWKEAAAATRDALVKADAANAETYFENADKYLQQLEELDKYVREQVQKVPESQRVLITAHDAFKYFGKAYGFEVRGLQGISTAAEAGARDVDELASFIAQRQIGAIFVESSVPQRTIKAVQEAVKAKGFEVKIGGELYSDALGSEGTVEGTYLGMVRHNIDTIVSALQSGS